MNRHLPDEAATVRLADDVLKAMPRELAGWTMLLSGELGAGKSTFARALIRGAGHHGAIPSPTYTLVEPYALPLGVIYHIDLYRIGGEDELPFLGWDELDDGFRLVEWPERAPGLAASADLALRLDYSGNGRSAVLEGLSERGATLIQNIK